jgi:signal transduction histidine kinase
MKFVLFKSVDLFAKFISMLSLRTMTILVAALFIAIASVIFSDNWIVSMNRQVEVIRLVRVNIATLHQLKADLFEAESAQRGYMLTKRREYVAPFNKALNNARINIRLSEKLVLDTSSELNQVVELEWLKAISASIENKSAEMILTIKLVELNKIDEANQVLNLDLGQAQMQRFVRQTDRLINQQITDVNAMIEKRKSTAILARTSVIGGSLVLILLVALVIKQLLREIIEKTQLQQQLVKENVVYEEKLQQQTKLLRSLALDYQADVERERQKLSRELHDELGSIFTATKMDIAWVIKKMKDVTPSSATDVVDKLRKTSGYVDQGIQYQRHIVQELHPSMLSTFGFWPALQSLINDAADRNQWKLSLNLPDDNTKLNETISLVSYRVVQETLNNANKYAKATAISVHMMVDEKYLKVEIEDNGVGVDMNALDGNTHGLSGMRHRILAIGGHFEILSQPGKGMLTRALIPLDVSVS